MTPIEIQRIASEELKPDEVLLWTGQPQPRRAVRQSIALFVFGCIFTGCSIPGLLSYVNIKPGTQDVASSPISILFVLAGFALLLSPAGAYFVAKRTVYAVTNQRIAIIKTAFGRNVQSFPPEAINTLLRTHEQSGSGDLIFQRSYDFDSEGDRRIPDALLLGIPDVADVERLIRETLGPVETDGRLPEKKLPAWTPVSVQTSRERIARQFVIVEEGDILHIKRTKSEDWRMRRYTIFWGVGCSLFLLPFIITGKLFSGFSEHDSSISTGYFSIICTIFLLIVIIMIGMSVITLLFGSFGSEEWAVSKNLFVVHAQMLGIRWKRSWSGCTLQISEVENRDASSATLSISDPLYRLKIRMLVHQTGKIEDVHMLADLLSHYSGWKVEIMER